MSGPRYTSLAASLPASVPFVGPETLERQRQKPFRARLGANESAFGPSPKAIAAMQAAAAETWMYGDPENHDLRQALAAHHAVASENIVVGEGIDAPLGYLTRLLIGPGDAVVTSDGAYPTFNYHVAGYGGTLHKVPYLKDFEDPDALLAKTQETGAKLIYLANPDNPMGSFHGPEVIQDMIVNLPTDSLLALDEAYVDLAPEGHIPQIDPGHPNVIRMRTFSKGYGLAGLRVGYALGAPELITAFNKIRNHFGVSRIAQAAARAALGDQDHLAQTRRDVTLSRERLGEIARASGLTPLPSATNFVTIDCGQDGDFARQVVKELGARDVFIRMPFVPPQDRAIRISCGPEAWMDVVADALPDALKAAQM